MTETTHSTLTDARNAVQATLQTAQRAALDALMAEIVAEAQRIARELVTQITASNSFCCLELAKTEWREGELELLRATLGPAISVTGLDYGIETFSQWRSENKVIWYAHTGTAKQLKIFQYAQTRPFRTAHIWIVKR